MNMIARNIALRNLRELLAIEGLSGREGRIAAAIRERLIAAGCRPSWFLDDKAHRSIPLECERGNLILKLPGTARGPRRLFCGHMDTVPLCRGARPVVRGGRIVAGGKTGLGADNRTAVACMTTVVETLLKNQLPHPPLTFLFTVAEEAGLWGARYVRPADLGNPAFGFNIDSGSPRQVGIGAIGADRWSIEVLGIPAHAAVHPEHGVSATLIAARAIADVSARGYFGRIAKGRRTGTANIGVIAGGEATNQVTDRVLLKGESRSHAPAFIDHITVQYRKAFDRAAAGVTNAAGVAGTVRFHSQREYEPFRLAPNSPVVKFVSQAITALGGSPELCITDGGLDANYLNRHGIPTVTLGAGQHGPHTFEEYVDIQEYLDGCRLALALAT